MLKLPSLSGLLTFLNAAETGNFTKTAKCLCITPAAVSQQVKQLEAHLDNQLFQRSKQGVELTNAGHQYLYFAKQAIESLQQGQISLQQLKQEQIISLQAFPSVASKWLMPKVLQIMEQNPTLEIRVEASHSPIDFNLSNCDACISFGRQEADLNHEFLFQDKVSLVASPALLANVDTDDLDALLNMPMIHIDWGDNNAFLPNWRDWLDAVGYQGREPTKGPQFNLSSMAIDAAIQGKGLLLGQGLFIEDALKIGELIPLSSMYLPLRKAYYLIYPERTKSKDKALDLIQKLKEKCG